MASIGPTIQNVMQKLSTIITGNGDGRNVSPYIRVWNNQMQYLMNGQMEPFPLPAFFVELQPVNWGNIGGMGVGGIDVTFTIHILHEFYDAQDGTMAQDLDIYILRDVVIRTLSFFQPTSCGPLQCVAERADYDHANVYHYEIDFTAHFIDDTGSKMNPSNGWLQYNDPPTDFQFNVTKE